MWNILRKKNKVRGLVGLAENAEGLALAWALPSTHGWRLAKQAQLPTGSSQPDAARLAELVSQAGLEGASCNYVLAPEDYKLLLVEAPKVKPDEVAQAVRWRIKDLVNQPLEDSAVDIFPVPASAYRSQGEMVYAVVTRRSRIVEIRDLVIAAGLELDAIDIPELAMHYLTTSLTDDRNGLAFLYMSPGGSILNLCKGGAIYLTRRLNTHIAPEAMASQDWAQLKDRLVLEIQRSLDYYESQMGQGQIGTLFISPQGGEDPGALARELNGAMGVRVESLDTAPLWPAEAEDRSIHADKLLAAGGALRRAMAEGRKRESAA